MGVAGEAQLAEMLERARKKLELLQRRGGKNTVARTVSQGWDLWPFESGRAKGCLRWHEMQLAEMLERVRKNVDTIIREFLILFRDNMGRMRELFAPSTGLRPQGTTQIGKKCLEIA